MSWFKRWIIMAGLFWPFLLPGFSPTQSPAALFFEANRAYEQGDFQAAEQGYTALLARGIESGDLYYNLGNTYFRIGDLGRAVLYYEKARRWMPRDDDLAFNLAHVRSLTRDTGADPQAFPGGRLPGLDSVHFYELCAGVGVLNVLFFGVLCVRLFKKSEATYYLLVFLSIFLCIGLAAVGLKGYGWFSDERAVVLAEELDLRAGPHAEDTPLFRLHAGALAVVERTEDGWVLLRLNENQRGWALSEHVARIVP